MAIDLLCHATRHHATRLGSPFVLGGPVSAAKDSRESLSGSVSLCRRTPVGNSGSVKARFVLGFLALDKPDTLTQDLADVLVPAGHNQSLDQPSLMIGQDNVARWHDVSCSRWHSMPMNPGLQGLSGEASHCRRGGVQRPAGHGRPACRLGRSWTEPACPRVARCIRVAYGERAASAHSRSHLRRIVAIRSAWVAPKARYASTLSLPRR